MRVIKPPKHGELSRPLCNRLGRLRECAMSENDDVADFIGVHGTVPSSVLGS